MLSQNPVASDAACWRPTWLEKFLTIRRLWKEAQLMLMQQAAAEVLVALSAGKTARAV